MHFLYNFFLPEKTTIQCSETSKHKQPLRQSLCRLRASAIFRERCNHAKKDTILTPSHETES